MKKSIKAIAAVAAAVTMAFSCVPRIYAAGGVPAVQAEEESVTKLEFTEGKTFETPYNGIVMFSDNDGTVYYYSFDSNKRLKIFTLDENGKIKNSSNFNIESYVNDNGVKIEPVNHSLKQCGEYLYFMYSYTEASNFSMSSEKYKHVIVKLDKELNEIERYEYKKGGRSIDTNGEKVVYIKNDTKICICDMDGKNLKTIYTVNNSDGNIDQPLNSIAIAGNYIGFQKRTGYTNASDEKHYCGMIDIETGEVTLKEQRSVQQVFSSGDNLIWYGDAGYDTSEDSSVPAGVTDIVAYMDSVYKYYDDSEFYIFDGENYSVLKTPNKNESGYGAVIDNEGNFITQSFDGKGHEIFRIYRNGKLLGEHIVSYKGYSCFTASNGVITISYTGQDAAPSDWVGFDLSTNTPSEKPVKSDKTPAVKEKATMKSVTIKYTA